MGLLTVQSGKKRYIVELEIHPWPRPTELPVKKLDAVFLEGHITSGNLRDVLNNPRIFHSRFREVIQKAKQSGTEIWLGDVEPTTAEFLTGLGIHTALGVAGTLAAAGAVAMMTRRKALRVLFGIGGAIGGLAVSTGALNAAMLSRKGAADKRRVSRKIKSATGRIDPVVYVRNAIMSHKIKALAERTGHRNIGVLIGAGHVELADLLQQGAALTPQQRVEIAKRGPEALKMYRCKYNKKTRKWNIEEHSL